MSDRPTTYRPNVGALLLDDRGRVLLAERINEPDTWQFPQGGIDPGESPEQALWRELGEELGFAEPQRVCELLGRGPATRYDFPAGSTSPVAHRFLGQEQILFVLRFTGTPEDFRLDHFEVPEFMSVRWFELEQARERIWALKRPIFEATVAALPEWF